MKPNFALDLSHDGISLYRRGRKEWLLVGTVALDDPEMKEALVVLRRTASGLDKAGISTQLIIPHSEVLHKEINAPEPDRDAGIVDALNGATPYGVDELVYDYSGSGDYVDVAVVAKETLAEAEAFAVEHGLNPVCFVASASDTPFPREIFFGETKFAQKFLRGEPVEPNASILPFRRDKMAVPDPAMTAAVAAESPAGAANMDEIDSPVAAPEAAQTLNVDAPKAAQSPNTEATPEEISATSNRTPPAPAPEEEPVKITFSSSRSDATPTPSRSALASVAPRIGLFGASPNGGGAPKVTADAGAGTGPAPRFAFTPPSSDVPPPKVDIDMSAIAPPPAATGPSMPKIPASTESYRPAPATVAPRKERFSGLKRLFGGMGEMVPAQKPPAVKPSGKKSKFIETKKASPPSEADALTVFGARKEQRRDRSKLGFALTLFLLLILLALAFGSSWFLSDAITKLWRDEPLIETVATGNDLLEMNDEAALDAEVATEFTTEVGTVDPAVEASTTGTVASETDSEPTLGAEVTVDMVGAGTPGPLTVQEAEVSYVASGIWQLAPDQSPTPGIENSDDVYVASLDPAIDSFDALALPDQTALLNDSNPAISSFPITPGTTFELDDRGFVKATPEGSETPEGVRVVAAAPPQKPPQRPAATLLPDAVVVARLQNARPRARPSDLSDRIERSTLSGRTLAELGSLKPKPRPKSQQDAAAENKSTPANPDGSFSDSKLAVLASIKPASRPENFDATVESALSSRVTTGSSNVAEPRSTSTSTSTRTSTTASSRSTSPAIPTRASVARSATQRNALRMNAVSLLGVTGKANAYRALVRLPSGRIMTVEVGDRLDGGKVAAIGYGTLNYVKGGRNLVLKMPDDG